MSNVPNSGTAGPSQRDDCIFCAIGGAAVIAANARAFAIRDRFPVTPLHTLVLPRRHVVSAFELEEAEVGAILRLLLDLRCEIERADPAVDGFNVGVNIGATAGQTVFHCHVHLIPRRRGDCANPRGGVRGVIPERQNY
jgi:diadenosine tetraphosphate (Ap4A) HIT family hydrolase